MRDLDPSLIGNGRLGLLVDARGTAVWVAIRAWTAIRCSARCWTPQPTSGYGGELPAVTTGSHHIRYVGVSCRCEVFEDAQDVPSGSENHAARSGPSTHMWFTVRKPGRS